ncbi:MAG: single-stranded-DNA-specific exonuclease RecJ [Peptococcaceae bacterium]|nr:single-stranded-DNA-specific exonuclease RecJ [Peptococcaceae bacterium]
MMKMNRWVVQNGDPAVRDNLVTQLGISPVLANLLINRGYQEPHEVMEFLNPALHQLSSPFEMLNMGAAAERILQAVERKEKIVVYGDYDVDGICASVTLYQGLKMLNADAAYYVPDRMEEGYGVNTPALRSIYEDGCRLLITVDCGISSWKEVAEAKSWGMDVIVTDHHQLPETLPDCIIVNPVFSNSEKDKWRHLCGTGVAFKVVQALFNRYYREDGFTERLRPFLDIVALATVADIVPLKGDNRVLVKFGLEEMALGNRLGLAALWKIAQNHDQTTPTTTAVGFGLAPRLNACGRIGDVRLGLQLLVTEDEQEAAEIAMKLDQENRQRQEIERAIYEEALEKVQMQGLNQQEGLIVVGEDWHPGVIGIVASRLVEKFYTPVIVLTLNNGLYKGSGRSIEGFHLQQALAQCSDLLANYGGHSQAAGLGLKPEDLPEFRKRFAKIVSESTNSDSFIPSLIIDSEIDMQDINADMYREISKIQPTGTMNPTPVFVCRSQKTLETRTVGANGDHLRIKLRSGQGDIFGIGFKKAELEPLTHEGSVDVAFSLDKNTYNGRTSLQMLIKDIKSYRRPDEMKLLDRLFFYKDKYLEDDPYRFIGQQDQFYTKAAGVTFENRQAIVEQLVAGQPLELVRERDNVHDENAIAVMADGEQIGYLKRNIARHLAPNFDQGISYEAMVVQVTGSAEKNWGVNIFIRRTDSVIAEEEEQLSQVRGELEQLDEDALKERIRQALLGEYDYRPKQQEALDALYQGDNVLAILGTGRGKSAIFQSYSAYLALWKRQVTIIVYPLRALVNDQYQALEKKLKPLGLKVRLGTGALEGEERASFFQQVMDGQIDVILTTPEFLLCHKHRFLELGSRLGMVVIDEAHHLASRRQGYKQLPYGLQDIRPRQVLAVTATAGEETAQHIVDSLHIDSIIIDPHIRENLMIVDERENYKKAEYLLQLIKSGEKVVVYMNSRLKAVQTAELLREKSPAFMQNKICYYHGGLASADRAAIENAFRSGELQVIVTTSAFGEGIDIPDIRHVVLYHLSFSGEEYNQLAGRAGRDGKPARVHLLYNRRDETLNKNVLASSCPSREVLGRFYRLLQYLVQGKPAIELTNAELVELVKRERIAEPTETCISGWLGIFEELGFLEREREGSKRRIIMIPSPNKMDLNTSLRYQECMAELEDFQKYLQIAFDHNEDHLLTAINRPIYPADWQ